MTFVRRPCSMFCHSQPLETGRKSIGPTNAVNEPLPRRRRQRLTRRPIRWRTIRFQTQCIVRHEVSSGRPAQPEMLPSSKLGRIAPDECELGRTDGRALRARGVITVRAGGARPRRPGLLPHIFPREWAKCRRGRRGFARSSFSARGLWEREICGRHRPDPSRPGSPIIKAFRSIYPGLMTRVTLRSSCERLETTPRDQVDQIGRGGLLNDPKSRALAG